MDMTQHIIRFASSRITWKIENICLAIRIDKNSIFSPDFILQGIPNTKWKMKLELTGNPTSRDSRLSFSLEKLPGSGPEILWANWQVALHAGLRKFGPYEAKCKFDHETSSKCTKNLSTIPEAIQGLMPMEPDAVTIKCYLIVYDNNAKNPMTVPTRGLLHLSDDFQNLKNTFQKYSDIKIRAQGKCIESHKVILSRSKTMEDYIQSANDGVIDIMDFDFDTVKEFVNFLYSGDIDFILGRPTIATMKLIEHFDSEILKSYYISEEMNMLSKTHVDTHEFNWVLNDILGKDEFTVSSPLIRRLNVDTVWKLTISVDPTRPGIYADYIEIRAEVVKGPKPCHFALEFALQTDLGHIYYPKRIVRFNGECEELVIKDFVAKQSAMDAKLVENNGLRILFRIRTSDGSQERSMGARTMSFVTSSGVKPHEQLSADTFKLLETKNYSDITVVCGNKTFNLHKCVLAARSHGFKERIESRSVDGGTLTVSDVKPDLLTEIIEYIYSGIVKKPEISRLLLLYTASCREKLHIPSLREESAKLLENNGIDIINKDPLTVAVELNNQDLIEELQSLKVNI